MDTSVRACCFDLGNTLSNDTLLTGESVRSMAQWLKTQGFFNDPHTFERVYMEINRAVEFPFISHTFGELEFFTRAFRHLGITALSPEQALAAYRSIVNDHTRRDPEVAEALDYLAERSVLRAILSNERAARVSAYLKATELRPRFDAIVVSESIGREKPDPAVFREALRLLGIPETEADTVLLFGDNSIADGACKQVGMRFVLVTAYWNRDWYFERGGEFIPDYTIERVCPRELERVLRYFSQDSWSDQSGSGNTGRD